MVWEIENVFLIVLLCYPMASVRVKGKKDVWYMCREDWLNVLWSGGLQVHCITFMQLHASVEVSGQYTLYTLELLQMEEFAGFKWLSACPLGNVASFRKRFLFLLPMGALLHKHFPPSVLEWNKMLGCPNKSGWDNC